MSPIQVRVGSALVTLQGGIGLAWSVILLVRAFQGPGPKYENLYATAAYYGILSLCVLAVAVSLWRGQRWARTPALVIEIIEICIAWWMISGSHRYAIGTALAGYSIAIMYFLMSRAAREWWTTE